MALPATLEGTLLQDTSPERSDLLLIRPKFTGASSFIASYASWSPDGQRIVYSNGHDLLVARNDGSEIHKLANFPRLALRRDHVAPLLFAALD